MMSSGLNMSLTFPQACFAVVRELVRKPNFLSIAASLSFIRLAVSGLLRHSSLLLWGQEAQMMSHLATNTMGVSGLERNVSLTRLIASTNAGL